MYQISATCFGAYCTVLIVNSLSLAENYLLIVMFLHWLPNIRYIIYASDNVVYHCVYILVLIDCSCTCYCAV